MLDTLLKKSQIVQSLQSLPDEIRSDDLIEHIIFMAQIERSLQQIDEGKVVSHEQVMQQLAELKRMKQTQRQAEVV